MGRRVVTDEGRRSTPVVYVPLRKTTLYSVFGLMEAAEDWTRGLPLDQRALWLNAVAARELATLQRMSMRVDEADSERWMAELEADAFAKATDHIVERMTAYASATSPRVSCQSGIMHCGPAWMR